MSEPREPRLILASASPRRKVFRRESSMPCRPTTVVIKIGTSSIVDRQSYWDESVDSPTATGSLPAESSKVSHRCFRATYPLR